MMETGERGEGKMHMLLASKVAYKCGGINIRRLTEDARASQGYIKPTNCPKQESQVIYASNKYRAGKYHTKDDRRNGMRWHKLKGIEKRRDCRRQRRQ